jgi:hypothetical protein
MKFWRQILLTVSLFTAIIITAVLSSCEKNSCDGIVCYNGGACGNGACTCPAGFEDPQCGTQSRERYLGTYGGYTTCDNGAPTIDTVTIYPANRGVLSVDVVYKSISPKTLQGYVSNNESTYSVIVTNNDSSKVGSINYLRVFTITLQADKTLKLHSYESENTALLDTFAYKCEFLGTKITP